MIARPMSGSAIGHADRDGGGGGDHRERDVGVGTGVRAVGDQRRAVEPPPGAGADQRGDPVAGEPDRPGGSERAQVLDGGRFDQAMHRLDSRRRTRCEDREHDRKTRPALGAGATQRERDAQRDRRGGVTGVVDRDPPAAPRCPRARTRRPGRRGDAENQQRQRNRSHPGAGTLDRLVDQAVGVAMAAAVVVVIVMVVIAGRWVAVIACGRV